MATAYPEDDAPSSGGDLNHNMLPAADGDFPGLENSAFEDGDEALTAEFRHHLGMLDESAADLSVAFKARLGLLGSEGMNEVAEMEIALEEERDSTLNMHKFSKFVKEHFKKGHTGAWTRDAITAPLLTKKHDIDKLASTAVWLAIQRFMGDIPMPEGEERKSRTPIMTKVFRSLEAFNKMGGRPRTGISSGATEENRESFKVEKRSSWKKMFSSRGSEKRKEQEKVLQRQKSTSSTGSASSREIEYSSSPAAMLESVPANDLDLVHFIVGHGILRKDLRDEIFAQLCRQVTKNPRAESEKRGWMLHALAAGCFVPSEQLMLTYRSFLRDAPEAHKPYARYTRRILRQTAQNGTRYHPPNWLEYQACAARKYVLLPVTSADRRVESVEADSATTAAEMCAALAAKLQLADSFGFSVYICIYDKVSSLGSGMDHVMDAISECEQVVRAKGRKEEDAPWRLYFRKEMFVPWHDAKTDDVATNLIYAQIVGGARSQEYRLKQDEDLSALVARRWFVDHGADIVPGKLKQDLAKYLPAPALERRSADSWTNAVIAAFEKLGLNKSDKAVSAQTVKQDVVMLALTKWPLQFSGLFEAFKIAGPKLTKNDVVLAVSHAGLFLLDEPYKVARAYKYHEIVEVFASRSSKSRGQSLSMVTVAGEEYTFISPNAETVVQLVKTFLDGLRQRSGWGVGLQAFSIKPEGSSDTFSFKQGDVLQLLDSAANQRPDWCYGLNLRTGATGPFPHDIMYVLPAIRKPPDDFLRCFSLMTPTSMDTLPRHRAGVVLEKGGTMGRVHGKDSAA